MYNHTTIGGFYTMAKLTMKDYENFLEEEARQDRLQEELESKRYKESYESEENWRDYQRKQEEDKLAEMMYKDDDCYLYWDDDCYPDGEYDPDCYSDSDELQDLLDVDVPCDSDVSLIAEDLYDMYEYASEEEYCSEYENADFGECCYMYPSCNMCSCYPCQSFFEMQILTEGIKDAEAERISRKSVARNRHLNEIKAKIRAQQSANILASKYHNSTVRTDYEEFRLYSRSSAAKKKAARVKTA